MASKGYKLYEIYRITTIRNLSNHYKKNELYGTFFAGGNLLRGEQRIGKDSLLLPRIGLRNEGEQRLTVEIFERYKSTGAGGLLLRQRERRFSKADTNLYFNIKPKQY